MIYVYYNCLLYTTDAADERSSVDLGGRRIIKKKTYSPAPTLREILLYRRALMLRHLHRAACVDVMPVGLRHFHCSRAGQRHAWDLPPNGGGECLAID